MFYDSLLTNNIPTTVIRYIGIRFVWNQLISPLWRIYASVNQDSSGSDNGLPPTRRRAIILANAGLLSIGPRGTNFSEI